MIRAKLHDWLAAGGEPGRAIDGNTDPEYGKNGQTHTQEGIENPWWEVDLGAMVQPAGSAAHDGPAALEAIP